ncbi:Metacaspase-9-like protein [Cladobotryum mycophilum]|uniref:Metacaspase-9-like protein n=1 Tax=Cladobotryum mycophilum TaxID=491253 RepID=A0ABR0T028_9HYPO
MSDPENYKVGWICAIKLEYVAAQAFLDEIHDGPQFISPNDHNVYALGRMGKHNVAIANLPSGEYGLVSAVTVANNMMHSFPNIRIGLMVRIGGSAPYLKKKRDIRLGDVVVSRPGNGFGGVIQYDFGKKIQDREFILTGFLNEPPSLFRVAIDTLEVDYEMNSPQLNEAIDVVLKARPNLQKTYERPDPSSDRLYRSDIVHSATDDDKSCGTAWSSNTIPLISRQMREEDEDNPPIRYGLIASANQLMKDALIRDKFATENDIFIYSLKMSKRYAVLVGIDHYIKNGSRKLKNNRDLTINNLYGCVNDVESMRNFLDNIYKFDDVSILTSSLPDDAADQGVTLPVESPDCWPTFDNIQASFDAVYDRATAGDFFFFHFSGHGARLKRVKGSPHRRTTDPSLLTVDFCCGKPAVRGWQLNQWLRKLNKKGVQVVVALDSCHSGGSWRAGGNVSFRTPNDWPVVPNLDADEEAAAVEALEADAEPTHRDAELETSWSINPDSFTLLAACGSDEKAAEIVLNGKVGGAFTHQLLDFLKNGDPQTVTYRMIRDQLKDRLKDQTPTVYGRDRLLFFDNPEPFAAVPLVVSIQDGMAVIPVGSAHGVNRGSEFVPFRDAGHLTLSVDEVEDFECRAKIFGDASLVLRQPGYMVVPSRWNLGREAAKVHVDPALGYSFRESLRGWLECRISSPVKVVEHCTDSTDTNILKLNTYAQESTEQKPQIWNNGRLVGPLRLVGDNIEELAAEAAAPLAHLIRFRQVLGLQARGSWNQPPFKVQLTPANGAVANAGLFPLTQKFRFAFENLDEEDLYFTVLVLSPEYSIQQLYPTADNPQTIAKGQKKGFNFSMKLPSGPQWVQETLCQTSRRDIIRTLVTKRKRVSWKSLELPNIWDASQMMQKKKSPSLGRDAVVDEEGEWWVNDQEILTSRPLTCPVQLICLMVPSAGLWTDAQVKEHVERCHPDSQLVPTPVLTALPTDSGFASMIIKSGFDGLRKPGDQAATHSTQEPFQPVVDDTATQYSDESSTMSSRK